MPGKKKTSHDLAAEAKEEAERRLETARARAAVAEEEEKEAQQQLIAEQFRAEVTANQTTRQQTPDKEDPSESPDECDPERESQTPPSEINVDTATIILNDIKRANNEIAQLLRIAQSLPDDCVDTRVYAELIRAIGLINVDHAMVVYRKAEEKRIVDTLILKTAIEMLIRTQRIQSAEEICLRLMNATAAHYGPEQAGIFYAEAIPASIKAASFQIHEAIFKMVYHHHDKAAAHLLTLANVAHTNLMNANLPINYDAVHAWLFTIALAYSRVFGYTDDIHAVTRVARDAGLQTEAAYKNCLMERRRMRTDQETVDLMNAFYEQQDRYREANKGFINQIKNSPENVVRNNALPVVTPSVQQATTPPTQMILPQQRAATAPQIPSSAQVAQAGVPGNFTTERKFSHSTHSHGMYAPAWPATQQTDFLQYLVPGQTTPPGPAFGRGRGGRRQ